MSACRLFYMFMFGCRKTPSLTDPSSNKAKTTGSSSHTESLLERVHTVCLPYTTTVSLYTHTHHQTRPFQKNRKKSKENREPETDRKHFDRECGRGFIANIQEANYKNGQYHFPLNSHNKKQPLLIRGKTCFLIKLEKKQL